MKSGLVTISTFVTTLILATGAFAQRAPDAEGSNISGVWWAGSYSPKLLAAGASELPFTPAGKAAYDKNMAGLKNGSVVDKARTLCVLDGVPRILETPYPFEVVQTPGQVTFLFEQNHTVRLVPLKEPLPKSDVVEDNPRFLGYSSGHWEGDALVVQSIGFNEATFLDAYGAPHSDQMKISERVRALNGGKQLEDVVTVDDPKNYAKPFDVRFVYDSHPEVQLQTYVCGEPHRDLSRVKGVRGF
jgi:hypothetical protein